MGYKILDVKADIHEDVEKYMDGYTAPFTFTDEDKQSIMDDICDIVDKHFERIER